jgi:hypothetical protein
LAEDDLQGSREPHEEGDGLEGGLKEALKGANFRVISVPKGTFLGHRILVTKNTKDFIDFAPVYDFGIISLEGLNFIDREREYSRKWKTHLYETGVTLDDYKESGDRRPSYPPQRQDGFGRHTKHFP